MTNDIARTKEEVFIGRLGSGGKNHTLVGWLGPSQSFELTRVPRPSSAWAGPLSGRMLLYYRKDACLLSARGPLRLNFYLLRLPRARVKGSGQECPLHTSSLQLPPLHYVVYRPTLSAS